MDAWQECKDELTATNVANWYNAREGIRTRTGWSAELDGDTIIFRYTDPATMGTDHAETTTMRVPRPTYKEEAQS